MKATLYDALGISPTSSDEEVRAALRGLIRKYYAKTRDGQGNVEEALRFINHASRILGDSARRERYDHELSRSNDEDTAPPSAQALNDALLGDEVDTDVDPATLPDDAILDEPIDSALQRGAAAAALHHPGLTERVASFSRSPLVTFGLCGLFAAFITAAIVFVTPADAVVVARQVLGWLVAAFIGLGAVYLVVHGLVYVRRHRSSTRSGLNPQTDLATNDPRNRRCRRNSPASDLNSQLFEGRSAARQMIRKGPSLLLGTG